MNQGRYTLFDILFFFFFFRFTIVGKNFLLIEHTTFGTQYCHFIYIFRKATHFRSSFALRAQNGLRQTSVVKQYQQQKWRSTSQWVVAGKIYIHSSGVSRAQLVNRNKIRVYFLLFLYVTDRVPSMGFRLSVSINFMRLGICLKASLLNTI